MATGFADLEEHSYPHPVAATIVSFDWFGTGLPSSQPFEIINPLDSQPIDSGNTVPEPTTICLFGIGALALLRKRRV